MSEKICSLYNSIRVTKKKLVCKQFMKPLAIYGKVCYNNKAVRDRTAKMIEYRYTGV